PVRSSDRGAGELALFRSGFLVGDAPRDPAGDPAATVRIGRSERESTTTMLGKPSSRGEDHQPRWIDRARGTPEPPENPEDPSLGSDAPDGAGAPHRRGSPATGPVPRTGQRADSPHVTIRMRIGPCWTSVHFRSPFR